MPKNENDTPPTTSPSEMQKQQSVEIILLISSILTLLEKFTPKIKEWTDGGIISKEIQDEYRARYDKLAGNMNEAFGGDHWKVRPDPSGNVPQIPTKMMPAKSAKPTDDAKDCSD